VKILSFQWEFEMKKSDRNALISFIIVVLVAVGVAFAGSQNGAVVFGMPLFMLAVALIFLVQWLVFIPSFINQTEKFYDITGSLTYISITFLAVLFSPKLDIRSVVLMLLVLIWAGRLGAFLFRRIHKSGKDDRFDTIKTSFWQFLNAWTLQALWITLTVSAALIAITSSNHKALDAFFFIGLIIWLFGFTIEAIADQQKNDFRANPENQGKFIQSGLWSKSRHPNYFGEITLWIGILIITMPVLQGWQWIAVLSPLFVTLLLTKVSGIPMLEKKADAKWGSQEDYETYKRNTPVLIPKL
jgi:steroid 5-alpha reductase family enzyme